MKKDNSTLKSYFETGDYPTESQFVDLIDSFLNVQENNAVTGITDNGNGTYTFQLLVGTPVTLDVAQLPDDIPIASIVGLQAALDGADPDNFLRKDQNETTTGSLSIGMASPGGGKSFSIGAPGGSAYFSMDANGNAVFGSNSSSDGQDSHLLVKRNGGLEFNDRGTVYNVWHSGNDTLIQRTDQNKSISNTAITHRYYSEDILESSDGNRTTLEVYQDTLGADAFMAFHVSHDCAGYFGLKGDINDFAVGGWTYGNVFHRVWHAGNDGAGSGLDADTLDGFHLGGTTGNNGQAWGYIPFVKTTDGVMEIGKYIDFHRTSNDGLDFSFRIHNKAMEVLDFSGLIESKTLITNGAPVNINYNAVFRRAQNQNVGIGQQAGEVSLEAFDDAIMNAVPFRIYGNPLRLIAPIINIQGNISSTGNGVFSSTLTATNFILSSDKTLKKNINDYIPRPINCQWRNFEWKNNGTKQIGVIAQELEKDHPEFVRTDEEGFKSVAYIDLLVAKMAEKDDEIIRLRQILKKMDERISVLEG